MHRLHLYLYTKVKRERGKSFMKSVVMCVYIYIYICRERERFALHADPLAAFMLSALISVGRGRRSRRVCPLERAFISQTPVFMVFSLMLRFAWVCWLQ